MKKRITWKNGAFIVIELENGLFTVAQMIASAIMRFYDIKSNEDDWESVNWPEVKPLFQVFVGTVVQKDLGVRKIAIESIAALHDHIKPYWIKPYTSMDILHYQSASNSFPFLGGKLIDLGIGNDRETTTAPVLKHDLSVSKDREYIEAYELTNMWGSHDLNDRLVRYFNTGINRDDLKFEVFPGLWVDREKLRPLTRRLPEPLR